MPVHMMPAKEGHCQVCAVKHSPEQPHNAQSLPYAMWFQSTYGRGVTWADAIAHCSPEIKKAWEAKLKEIGAWTEPEEGAPIATVDESGGKPTLREMPNMEPKTVPAGRSNKK